MTAETGRSTTAESAPARLARTHAKNLDLGTKSGPPRPCFLDSNLDDPYVGLTGFEPATP